MDAVMADLVQSQNVARKRLKVDPAAGRPRSTGQTTPVPEATVDTAALPYTVIRPVRGSGNPKQDQESESDWSASVEEHEIDPFVLNNLKPKMRIEKLKGKSIAIPVGPCEKNDLIKLLIEHEVLNNLKSKILIEKLKGKGIAIPVGPCEKNDLIKLLLEHTPAVPHTVICPVQGSVGNSASGLAVLYSPCNPVPEAAVDALL